METVTLLWWLHPLLAKVERDSAVAPWACSSLLPTHGRVQELVAGAESLREGQGRKVVTTHGHSWRTPGNILHSTGLERPEEQWTEAEDQEVWIQSLWHRELCDLGKVISPHWASVSPAAKGGSWVRGGKGEGFSKGPSDCGILRVWEKIAKLFENSKICPV